MRSSGALLRACSKSGIWATGRSCARRCPTSSPPDDVEGVATEAGVPPASVESMRNEGIAALPDMIAVTEALGLKVAVFPAMRR